MLDRLRDPTHDAPARLARLLVDDVARRPWRELVDREQVTTELRDLLDAISRRPALRDALVEQVTAAIAEGQRPPLADRTARALLPAEVDHELRHLLELPWTPSEALVYRVINHDAVRVLVREVLSQSLRNFVHKARGVDGMLGGLGAKAVQRGRSLFGGLAGAAEGLVGAVREEVEGAVEHKISDFVGSATDEVMRAIARWIADPAHAPLLVQLRVSALDMALDTPVRDVAHEAATVDVARLVDGALGVARATLLPHAGDGQAVVIDVTDAVWQAVDKVVGDGTVEEILTRLDIADVVRPAAERAIERELRRVFATDAFAAWWSDLTT